MDRDHYWGFRPPDDFDSVVHKIETLLTCWADMEREGAPLQEMKDLIEFLTHEPLARATAAATTPTEFDAVTDNLQTLLRLHHELEHKGFSVEEIRCLIHFLLGGPVPRAALGPHLHPDLMQSLDKAPNDAATADASTGAIQPFPTTPATILPQSIGRTPNNAATVDTLTEEIQPFLAMPIANIPRAFDKVPNNAATADASTGAFRPFPAMPAMNPLQNMGKDPVRRELSAFFGTRFNELCPVNLLGSKCKCELLKVNLKDPSLYKEQPWLQPTCKAFLEDKCTGEGCNKAHNFLVERRRMASESRLQDHRAYILECKELRRNKQKA